MSHATFIVLDNLEPLQSTLLRNTSTGRWRPAARAPSLFRPEAMIAEAEEVRQRVLTPCRGAHADGRRGTGAPLGRERTGTRRKVKGCKR